MANGIQIARLAQMACIWEACAPKPGNVNRAHNFSDTSLEDFLLSAVAIGPVFEKAAQTGIGQMVWQSIVETRRWVKTNTNLGLILLLAPLVKACASLVETVDREACIDLETIRRRLKDILNSLTVEDARHAYAAIRLAQPGGIGRVSQADIVDEPEITLLQAMTLAQDRDAVAREYATGYAITFEIGLPALKEALCQGGEFSKAIVQAFLVILKHVPDTLIARKRGLNRALQVSQQADDVLRMGGAFTPQGQAALTELDRALRDETHTLNPGATADLTATTIFLSLLEKESWMIRSASVFDR
jgi:triphosphoribosyl-dephospho-CoA synthase